MSLVQAAVLSLLLLYQIAWINDRSPVRVWEKSRRIGASWAMAFEAVTTAALRRDAGGMDAWYVGYNKDMAEEFIRDCAFWAKEIQGLLAEVEEVIIQDEKGDILAFRIKFASGFRITALSSRPSNLRGKQGLVIIDEAAFHDDLAELLKAALALLMWGGRVCILSTHNGVDNPFNELVEDIRAGKKPYSLHRTDFDQALEQGLYQRICKRTGQTWSPEAQAAWRQAMVDFYGEGADEELFCIPSRTGGAWLTRNLIENCMQLAIPVIRWSPPEQNFVDWPMDRAYRETLDWCEANLKPRLAQLPNLPTFFGEDFGRTGDLTVVWPMQRLGSLALHTLFVLEIRNAPFRTQEQLLSYVVDRLPVFQGGALDARGNGQALAEYARQTYGAERIAEVMLSEPWYREHMPRLKAHLEDQTMDLPRDQDILDDFRGLAVTRGVARPPEKSSRSKTGQRHCDSAVAAALAAFAEAQIDTGPVEYTGAGHRRMSQIEGAY